MLCKFFFQKIITENMNFTISSSCFPKGSVEEGQRQDGTGNIDPTPPNPNSVPDTSSFVVEVEDVEKGRHDSGKFGLHKKVYCPANIVTA